VTDAAQDEARTLLGALADVTADESWRDLEPAVEARADASADLSAWEARLVGAGVLLAQVSAQVGHPVRVDALDLLNQRAALRGLKPGGAVSAGGGCRLLPTGDGWIAVSLNRAADWELVPALLGIDADGWDDVATAIASTTSERLTSAAGLLGLAIAALPAGAIPADEQWRSRHERAAGPWVTTSGARARTGRAPARVIDLSSLWAGPLCASLLRRAGAEVVTVESTSRPDGARRGDPELHQLLHDGNSFVTLDVNDPAGLTELHRLIDQADVVVSSARMRALQQLGLDPFAMVERRPGLTWVGISAYGLTGPWSNRIGYGDDAAVAGGLVVREPTPAFYADAAADPITGLYAAIAAIAVSASGGGVIDAALRDAAAHVARPVSARVGT
jgi:crotonobetainyl-CoA:carnitine CoA-transferase CaiB-like acyl-CoA transferase